MTRGDGPFHVLNWINDNAYKIGLFGEYNVNATFNIANLSLFLNGDLTESRITPFQEGENHAETRGFDTRDLA